MNPFAAACEFERTLAAIRRIVRANPISPAFNKAACTIATATRLTRRQAGEYVASRLSNLALWGHGEEQLPAIVEDAIARYAPTVP